jgi:hypothetical protein
MEEVPQAYSVHKGYFKINGVSLEYNIQRLQGVPL